MELESLSLDRREPQPLELSEPLEELEEPLELEPPDPLEELGGELRSLAPDPLEPELPEEGGTRWRPCESCAATPWPMAQTTSNVSSCFFIRCSGCGGWRRGLGAAGLGLRSQHT
ncbi:MAG: hypothetical protein HY553_22215 [Elusimicrobia bacterium]|nr:hypothetical protein [Elusimicrobiota bacterium]